MSDSADNEMQAERAGTVRVVTGARLHFGLLNTVVPFGGIGVMIDQPATEIVATRCWRFECDHALQARLLPIARRVQSALRLDQLPACRIELVRRPPAHVGLGSGTQLSLAVAESLCGLCGLDLTPDVMATEIASRGDRSAVGIHGYFHGGLILESGDQSGQLNPLTHRCTVPDSWHVAVVRPKEHATEISGQIENQQFDRLPSASPSVAGELVQLAKGIVSALEQADFRSFTERVEAYNRLSGTLFAPVQGGPYNGSHVTELVDLLKRTGGRGVGQSSWGPGVFVWFDSRRSAEAYLARLPANVELIALAGALNRPRDLTSSG